MLQNRKEGRSRQYQIVQPVQLVAESSAMTPTLTCKTRHAPSREEHPERWPSGLRRTLGKRVCGKPYRGFESHSLRQQVIDIKDRIQAHAIRATFPSVSDRIRKSSKLRARIIAIFCNPLAQFSEGHFASAVLAARNFNKANSIQETGVQYAKHKRVVPP